MTTNSKKYVIEAPMSFTGSARRLWNISDGTGYHLLAAVLIPVAWSAVAVWYLIFGVLVIPYRLFRRGQRRDKLARLRHDEIIESTRRKQ